MGDIILTTPLIRAIGEAMPGAEIYYLAETPFNSLLEHHPLVTGTVPFDFSQIRKLRGLKAVGAQTHFVSELRKHRFDLAIDLFGNPRSALQARMSGAKYRIGGDFPGRGKLYNYRIDYHNKNYNAIDFHLKALEPLGINPPQNPVTEIFVTDEEQRWAQDYLKKMGINPEKKIVGIHPGATWPAKMWLVERFAALIREIKNSFNAEIVLTHGPGEDERIKTILKNVPEKIFTADILSLRRLAALLKQFNTYISNDCGPMHLSVAVGTKTLGIFGPSEPQIWFPYSPKLGHRYIHKADNCWPCHQDFCDTMACMKNITVKEVLRLTAEML